MKQYRLWHLKDRGGKLWRLGGLKGSKITAGEERWRHQGFKQVGYVEGKTWADALASCGTKQLKES